MSSCHACLCLHLCLCLFSKRAADVLAAVLAESDLRTARRAARRLEVDILPHAPLRAEDCGGSSSVRNTQVVVRIYIGLYWCLAKRQRSCHMLSQLHCRCSRTLQCWGAYFYAEPTGCTSVMNVQAQVWPIGFIDNRQSLNKKCQVSSAKVGYSSEFFAGSRHQALCKRTLTGPDGGSPGFSAAQALF